MKPFTTSSFPHPIVREGKNERSESAGERQIHRDAMKLYRKDKRAAKRRAKKIEQAKIRATYAGANELDKRLSFLIAE